MSVPRVAIIGGGVSGLSTAYYLLKLKKSSGKDFEIVLFEAARRLGGTIETEEADGFILEKGPDAFMTDKPWALTLARELGLDEQIMGTCKANQRSFIARGGRLLTMPEGFYLTAPLDIVSFLRSSIVSWPGKFRMMAEPFIPKKNGSEDESLASFVVRRFGREALERVAQPMLGGVYTGDPARLSLRATMPRFFELEQKYGSLTNGLRAAFRGRKGSAVSGPRYSLFISFKAGTQTFIDALAKTIPPSCFRMSQSIKSIRLAEGSARWSIDLGASGKESFDAVCITSSAKQASGLLGVDDELTPLLSKISYESVMTINLIYRTGQITHPLDGFGFVVPEVEKKLVIACTFSNRKFEGRAPAGYVLLRAFVGGAFGRDHFEKSDADILAQAISELAQYLGIQGGPVFTRLRRYPKAMVQYTIGHLDLVSEIERRLVRRKGLYLTGSSYKGVGIPDCVRQAELTAQQIFESLGV